MTDIILNYNKHLKANSYTYLHLLQKYAIIDVC